MSCLNTSIVVCEAKVKDILGGFYKNLVQQRNALESLADKLVGSVMVGKKRTQEFVKVLTLTLLLGKSA